MNKVGIYSGTFDPVHMGHVEFALEALDKLALTKVVFLPEILPRLKKPTAIQHRHKMLELSLHGQENLSVKVLDTPRFNIKDTLPELRLLYGDAPLVFLLGSDIVKTFKYRWPGLEDLLASVEFAISIRGEDTKEEITELLKECAVDYGTPITFHIVPNSHAHLTSTHIRQGTHTIEDIHPDVAAYIQRHNLYR
jgi:nicotinate-nucleotide adenylyltransferase